MTNWNVLVQREQIARDREGKKLGELMNRRSEYSELRIKTRAILTQYEEQLKEAHSQPRLIADTHLYRISIGQMRNALEQLDGQIYRLNDQINRIRSVLGQIECERQKYQLLVEQEEAARRIEAARDDARILDDFSTQRFNQHH
ncbi:flagellar FliJ family protein [Litoricolaceae bacterium]|nr:flagellar FliJ family protein [Litorivicinaceae bacterium]